MSYQYHIDVEQIWRCAYLELKRRDGKHTQILAQSLQAEGCRVNWALRDHLILGRCEYIYRRWGERLVSMADTISTKLLECDHDSYHSLMTSCCLSSPDSTAYALAHSVAIIAWWRAVWQGQVQEHPGDTQQAQVWLGQHAQYIPISSSESAQLTLF